MQGISAHAKDMPRSLVCLYPKPPEICGIDRDALPRSTPNASTTLQDNPPMEKTENLYGPLERLSSDPPTEKMAPISLTGPM